MTWYERDPSRLLAERQLLARFYPNARMVRDGKQIRVFLRVKGKRRSYLLRIDYPKSFPHEPPRAYPVDPVIKEARHQYTEGRLCLHDQSETGPQTTCKVICDWCVCWIEAYEAWLASGKRHWPATNRK